jgi:indolepyruvate ferredoxin oxidoreductase, alpha subunit
LIHFYQLAMTKQLLSGNEAIARGAYEAGCKVATGYPGTPSTEILEVLSQHKDEVYCEWSPNEKVAFEVAVGASLTGARAIVTMKHVGLNVAADPLMTFANMGAIGGMVVCVADDPGMHSSQNEQDTRHYARFAKIPLLEPADSQEAKDFLIQAMEIAEKFLTPVILRTTTRVSHSRSVVTIGPRVESKLPIGFKKDQTRFVAIPQFGRLMRDRAVERLPKLAAAAEQSPLNRIEWRDRKLGIIANGIAYQYVSEVFPEFSVLKLGWTYPFPDGLIRQFAEGVERVLVVEELDDFLEEHVRALGIDCVGKKFVPKTGELSVTRLMETRAAIEGRPINTSCGVTEQPDLSDLPPRPPVLCSGCPHRGLYYALSKFDVVVTGDIGCYSLGTLKPLDRMDTLLCMGAGVSMAHGMIKAGEPKKVVGILGDSTFFHSGITSLLDIGYNRGKAVIIVVDNRTTAMTGHQEHPGTGKTLMDDDTWPASIEAFGRACGIANVVTIDPHDLKKAIATIAEAIESDQSWLIVSSRPCPLHERKRLGPAREIDDAFCKECGACFKLGCPAIEGGGEKPSVNALLCAGCGLCQQVCKFGAVNIGE